jgi:serine/threonine protein kinase/ATP/maltotriose-dependent transcriptional regulator MalT
MQYYVNSTPANLKADFLWQLRVSTLGYGYAAAVPHWQSVQSIVSFHSRNTLAKHVRRKHAQVTPHSYAINMELIGQTLGQYHIVETIGRGGMATVFKARQATLERFVAVKVLMPQQAGTPEFRERFIREAKAVAQLNHPNILPIIDYGQSDDLIYIVMKYVGGGTLADRLKHPIDLATTTRFITQLAGALDHAHGRGILHRDVKPSNVLLDEGEWAQLADFGLAKIMESDQLLTRTGLSMGTPAYFSPEQAQGLPLDHHTDLYALGVILYEMVTGRLPFSAETPMGIALKHIYDQPLSPRALQPDLPEALAAVVLRGLAKPIEQRYHSAGELVAALHAAVVNITGINLSPIQNINADTTLAFNSSTSPRTTPLTPITLSNKILFEETVPAVPHFIGREAELAAYRARLERDRLLILTGLAGMGKTLLGAKLARDLTDNPDAIFWYTFDPVEKSTADALYWALGAFLDNRGEPSLAKYLRGEIGAQRPLERTAKLNLLIAALSAGDYVLCFDDLQIVKDAPDIAYIFKVIRQRFVELKQPLPARFILMGREIPADLEYLAADAVNGLSLDETARFLTDHQVTLPLNLVAALWQHTAGNLKLLELSAVALAGLPVESAADFIASLVRKGDIRDYLMRNIYAALTPDEQLVMSALAVFPAPIERAGVEELLADNDIANIAQHVDALVNKHVLSVDHDDRIDCHKLVREYCYHVLNRRERDRFHQRAAEYFTQEQYWIAAAFHHFERRAYSEALDTLAPHAEALINAGQAAALSELLQRFDPHALSSEQRFRFYQMQGRADYMRGEFQAALAVYFHALEVAPGEVERATLLQLIARTYVRAGKYEQVASYAQRSLQTAQALSGQAELVSLAHNDLGWAHFRLGQLAEADESFDRSEQAAQTAQRPVLKGDALLGHGVVAWKQNRLDEARDAFETCRRIFHEYRVPFREASALNNLGLLYHSPKTSEQALAYYRQALALAEKAGSVYDTLFTIHNIAEILFLREQYAESEETNRQLQRVAQAMGHRPMLSMAHCGLADVALACNDLHNALQHAVAAQQIAEETGNRIEQLGIAYRILGEIWLRLEDYEQARVFFEQSLPLLEQHQLNEDLGKARAGYEMALRKLTAE